jgi:hypothetical protein
VLLVFDSVLRVIEKSNNYVIICNVSLRFPSERL